MTPYLWVTAAGPGGPFMLPRPLVTDIYSTTTVRAGLEGVSSAKNGNVGVGLTTPLVKRWDGYTTFPYMFILTCIQTP